MLAAALDDLEGAHAVVLETPQERPPHAAEGKEPPAAWSVAELDDRVPLEDFMVRACLGTLSRHGLARDVRGPYTPEAFELTTFGRTMLELIRLSGRPSLPPRPQSKPTRLVDQLRGTS